MKEQNRIFLRSQIQGKFLEQLKSLNKINTSKILNRNSLLFNYIKINSDFDSKNYIHNLVVVNCLFWILRGILNLFIELNVVFSSNAQFWLNQNPKIKSCTFNFSDIFFSFLFLLFFFITKALTCFLCCEGLYGIEELNNDHEI